MSWVEQLLKEYRQGRKTLNKRYKEMDSKDPDRKIIGSMARDMTFVIEWLETGRMPGTLKGIHGKREYEINQWNSKPVAQGIDSYWDESIGGYALISNYADPYQEAEGKIDSELGFKEKPEVTLTNEQKKALIEVLAVLSHRERHCFVFHTAYLYTYREIGDILNISLGAVQKYMERARAKIEKMTS